jgi:ribosomal protein L21E
MKVGDLVRSKFQPSFQIGLLPPPDLKGETGIIIRVESGKRYRVQFSAIQWILSENSLEVIDEYQRSFD